MARNRIIYASQSVWVNGEILYRVQSLGTTTTFTSEDIFELGHLDIVDVVDDVPAVAVTLNTNDFGDVKTLAILAQIAPAKLEMSVTATSDNANLVSGADYFHGVSLADFAIQCGNLPGVSVWAPVQSECDMGTLANNIDQTLFLDEVYVNSLEFGYSTGANATENYGAETDNKMWLLNDGRFVNYESTTFSGAETYIDLTLTSGTEIVATLNDGSLGFLRKSSDGAPGVSYFDDSGNNGQGEMVTYEIVAGSAASATTFVYDTSAATGHRVWLPTGDIGFGIGASADDRLEIVYAANAYADPMNKYFEILDDTVDDDRPYSIGALRQGQVEIYILDPDNLADYENAWRLTACTITSDLTREALAELGHLGPYDRPLTLPIPITVTIDSTAGDLENWARFAGEEAGFDADTLDSLNLADLINKENMILVVKVFSQTDEEAGGTGANRKIRSGLVGEKYFWDSGGSTLGTYASAGDQEFPLKTIIVKNLKMTDEGATLDVGANMTQTFGFRSNNDLFVVKGDIGYDEVIDLLRNSS